MVCTLWTHYGYTDTKYGQVDRHGHEATQLFVKI